jgi:hypothetical protein
LDLSLRELGIALEALGGSCEPATGVPSSSAPNPTSANSASANS